MPDRARWRRRLEPLLSIGADARESETERSARRVVIAAVVIASLLSIATAIQDIAAGDTAIGVMNLVLIAVAPVVLLVIAWRPRLLKPGMTVLFALVMISSTIEAVMYGGLLESGLAPIFGIIVVLASLLLQGVRTAMWWFAAFVGSVLITLAVSGRVEPRYDLGDPSGDAAFNMIATAIVVFAVLAYFVRQRDRFQQRSDELLHNALPNAIVARLKDDETRIADDVHAATVLFADVVGFTPMSASMTPSELVDLLDELFTRFDSFAAELGIEKIKTIGDAYMAAAGVPTPRDDHAVAIAELAIRMRDHLAASPIHGRSLALRVGIASGPLTAGVIGTNRVAYDLWGDTVNTASRMESSATVGSIQTTPQTHALLADRFVCEPRGRIEVKGKGQMETFVVVARRDPADTGVASSSASRDA